MSSLGEESILKIKLEAKKVLVESMKNWNVYESRILWLIFALLYFVFPEMGLY